MPDEQQTADADESGDMLLRALRELPMVLFRLDSEGKFVESTGGGLGRIGVKDGEVVGRDATESFPEAAGALRRALDGETVRYETRGERDGAEWWFDSAVVPDPAGTGGVFGLSMDITERKRMERRLHLRNQRMDAILGELPVLFFTADADGRVRHADGSGLARIGVNRDDVKGLELLFEFAQLKEHLERAYKGEMVRFVAHGTSRDGPWWFDTFFGPDPGFPGGIMGFAIDVTERMQARQALRDQRDHLHRLTEEAADAIFVHDLEGRIVHVNRRACDSLGHPPTALLELTMDRVLTPSSGDGTPPWIGLQPGETRTVQASQTRADGSVFPVEARVGLVREGDSDLVLAIVRDVTERRRAEEDRLRVEERLRHSQKLESLGILAGGIAHDFNNLLTGVIGHASLLLDGVPADAPTRASLEQIERAASRAAELAQQMLAYSGRGRFVVRRVDISLLVEEMAHLLASSMAGGSRLHYELLPDLPPVEADPAQLTQVVMNLITNAGDATRERGGTVHLRTGLHVADRRYLAETYVDDGLPPGRYVFLEVTDDGCGMDSETCARLFDPFFTTKPNGRGLGLAAALGIVRGHRGAIRVKTRAGVGTTIRVLLPSAEGPADREPERQGGIETWTHAGTVLVVDDEPSVREVVRAVLERLGLTILLAEDGDEGVQLVRERHGEVELVLLDLTMPRMGGDEAFTLMRATSPELPVILMSGFTEQDVAHRFADCAPSGFLHKPFRPEVLVAAVRSALARVGSGSGSG